MSIPMQAPHSPKVKTAPSKNAWERPRYSTTGLVRIRAQLFLMLAIMDDEWLSAVLLLLVLRLLLLLLLSLLLLLPLPLFLLLISLLPLSLLLLLLP